MTIEERLESLERSMRLACEALDSIRKIMGLQEQRLFNLENFMKRATGQEPNPYVGVPPSDL